MKYYKFSFILLLLLLVNINLKAQTQMKDLSPQQYFDFWIGEWDLSWRTNNNTIVTGENIIIKTLNDKVIEENFKAINDPNMKGYIGRSWSVYNSNSKTWNQTWVDNQGAYLDFIGEFNDEKRIFKRTISKPDGTEIQQRMVFYNIEKDSFSWDWENSTDNGITWNLQWSINYKRKHKELN